MSELSTTAQKESPEVPPGQNHDLKLAQTVKIMERLHATRIFGTPEQSKEFLDSLDYDGFKQYISFVNGIERGVPATKRGKVSNSHVQSSNDEMGTVVDYRPPHRDLRDRLLKMAFEKAQTVEDPAIAGLTLGLAINAVHYFDDGNGRTARMTYALLSKGYDGSPEAQQYYSSLLENTQGRQVINPNPATSGIDRKIRAEMMQNAQDKYGYTRELDDKIPTYLYESYPDTPVGARTPKDLAVADDIDAQGRLVLHRALESGGMDMIALLQAFEPKQIKDFVQTSPDGARTYLDGSTFLPTLTKEEIIQWWGASEEAIYMYVEKLINFSDRDDAAEIAAYYSR